MDQEAKKTTTTETKYMIAFTENDVLNVMKKEAAKLLKLKINEFNFDFVADGDLDLRCIFSKCETKNEKLDNLSLSMDRV